MPLVQEKKNALDFVFKDGSIEFYNLGYTHYIMDPPKEGNEKKKGTKKEVTVQEKRLFENFCLKIEAGTTNAIVGQSGFGKTTLLNLLFRIYDPSEGKILLDGQDIRDLKFESFRRYISIIP